MSTIKFGEVTRYEKHGSEKMEAEYEFILRDCKTSGFRDNKFGSGKQLPISLSSEHKKILEDIMSQCKKELKGARLRVQTPWSEGMVMWAKVASDAIIRKGENKEPSETDKNTEPFKADVLFEMHGVFVTSGSSKAYIQLKVVEVLIRAKEPRVPKL